MTDTTNAKYNTDATPSRPRDNYFGACPECGRHDGYVNLGRNHIFICREHRTGWCIGSNLFSSWQDQTPEQQAEVERMLEDYYEVEPIYPDRDSDSTTKAKRRALDDDIPW